MVAEEAGNTAEEQEEGRREEEKVARKEQTEEEASRNTRLRLFGRRIPSHEPSETIASIRTFFRFLYRI